MAKHPVVHDDQELFDDEDFFDDGFEFSESCGTDCSDHDAADAMIRMIDASATQLRLALDLTKLVLENQDKKAMQAEDIFTLFKTSASVISEINPIQHILSQCEE